MASGDDCHCHSSRSSPRTILCSPENPYYSIRKLVNLMENSLSTHLVDRQLLILKDFLAACPYAFWARDLPYIMKLLELLIERIKTISEFRKLLELLLETCAVPPMLVRASEALDCMKDLTEYFSLLGYIFLCLHDEDLKRLVLRAILCLLERKSPVGICCVTLDMCQRAVERSQLPEIISQLLEVIEEEMYEDILKVALRLAEVSNITCEKMAKENILEYLMLRLDYSEKKEDDHIPLKTNEYCIQYYEYFYKITWLILNTLRKKDANFLKTFTIPSCNALKSFQTAFRCLTSKKGQEIKRNIMLTLLLILLDIFPNLEFTKSRLADDVALLSVASELGTGGTWASLIRFTAEDYDYQFKKLLLVGLNYITQQIGGYRILQERKVIPGLLRLITPELTISWHPQSHCKLIILALYCLQITIPYLSVDFINYNGPTRILMMIEFYLLETYDITALQACLNTLYAIVFIPKVDICEVLRNNGAISILVSICNKILSIQVLTLTYQRCLAQCFCILEVLYRKQQIPDNSVVNLSFTYFERILNPSPEDPSYDPKVLICLIDFIWESVVWNEENLKYFVEKGGVYNMLDIIQSSIHPVKLIGLSFLVDLCEEGSCIPHLVTWRKSGKKIIPMLLDIFRDENRKLGVKSTPKGVIADLEIPIMGEQQWYETNSKSKDKDSSPAAVDLLASCRPKIYALLQLLHFRHQERVAIANEHYRMYNEDLCCDDKITMLLTENFLALKLGEAWVELNNDFERNGIRPLAIDGQVIETLIKRYHKWALHLKNKQEELLKNAKRQDEINERILYNLLKESRLSSSLAALHELDFIARTTENMFRYMHKMIQRKQIKYSLNFDEANECQHRTFMYEIDVNPVFDQVISIQSNKIIDPNKKKFDIRPVSSDSEEELRLFKKRFSKKSFTNEDTSFTDMFGLFEGG